MRFEDLAGSEEIYLHAQKDFRRVVKNDDTLTVEEGDRTIEIKQGKVSETLDVGDYATKLSQGDRTIELSQGNFTETLDVGDHATKLSAGNHSVKLSAGASSVDAMQSITLTGRQQQHHDRQYRRHDQGHDGQHSGPDAGRNEGRNGLGQRRWHTDPQGQHDDDQLGAKPLGQSVWGQRMRIEQLKKITAPSAQEICALATAGGFKLTARRAPLRLNS